MGCPKAYSLLGATLAWVAEPSIPATPVPTPSGWLTQVHDRYPHLSPDGRTIVFESDRTEPRALFLSNVDGTNVRVLVATEGKPENGSWSPDGTQIVYDETVGDEPDIFVINSDGTGRRNLTQTPFNEGHPHWSADGTRIYFSSDRATPDRSLPWEKRQHNIFSMKADGSDIRQHTHCTGWCTNPNPSPDGKAVAFRLALVAPAVSWAQTPSIMNSEIGLLNLRTGAIVNLTRSIAYDTWPSWSPDSRWIVYGSNRDGKPNNGQLFMTSIDGEKTVRLTSGPDSYGEPSFSKDGSRLYFSKSPAATGLKVSFIASAPAPPH